MHIDDLKTGALTALGRIAEGLHELVNLLDGQLARHTATVLVPRLPHNARRRDEIVACHEGGVEAGMHDLQAGHRTVVLQRLGQDGHRADVGIAGDGQAHMMELGHTGVIHIHDARATVGCLGIGLHRGPAGRTIGIAQLGAHGLSHDAVLDLEAGDIAAFEQLREMLVLLHYLNPF